MFIAPIGLYSANTNKFRMNKSKINFSGKYVSYNDAEELIKKGDYEGIKKLDDIHIINKRLESLLHSSAKYSQSDISRYLLNRGLNPNQKNYHGKTPFSIACAKNDRRLVETFLLYDVDVNTADGLGNTPLHKAFDSPEITKLLLQHNANPYFANEYMQMPFELAYNNPKTLETYLNFKVNPNTENKDSQTLLHKSIANGRTDIADLLKKYGSEINYKDKNGRTPLFYADNPESLKWLIKNGAKMNVKDNNGQTALYKQVQAGRLNLTKGLIKYGADVNITDNRNLPPLAYAKHINMMKLLLENGANPDVVTPKGSTILQNCAETNNLEAVFHLTNYKANPNLQDKENRVPLDVTKDNDVRAVLLAAGANPNYRPYLIESLKTNNAEFFNYLLESGANPDIQDSTGKTAVFFIKNKEELETLKKYNANINHYNKDGYTPLLHFTLLGDKEKVKLLQLNGAKDLPSQKGETVEDCLHKYETYHKWIKKPAKTPTFTGEFSYSQYGTPELRENLNYKTQLTKEKIDTIIANSSSTDVGLAEAYKQLKAEENKIYKAINSLNPIIRHFNAMIKDDINKLASKNPSGSKIPVVGIVKQYQDTVFSNKFSEELKLGAEEIKGQYEEIIKNYYSKNITELISNYNELNKYITDGIEYINYVKGNSKTRNNLLERLRSDSEKCKEKNLKCEKNINKISKKYENVLNRVIHIQEERQEKRTARKTVIKIITLGLS